MTAEHSNMVNLGLTFCEHVATFSNKSIANYIYGYCQQHFACHCSYFDHLTSFPNCWRPLIQFNHLLSTFVLHCSSLPFYQLCCCFHAVISIVSAWMIPLILGSSLSTSCYTQHRLQHAWLWPTAGIYIHTIIFHTGVPGRRGVAIVGTTAGKPTKSGLSCYIHMFTFLLCAADCYNPVFSAGIFQTLSVISTQGVS